MPAHKGLQAIRWLFVIAAGFSGYIVILTFHLQRGRITLPLILQAAFGIIYLLCGIALKQMLRRTPLFVTCVILLSAVVLVLLLPQNLMHKDVPHSLASIVGLLVCFYLFGVTRRLAKELRG